MKVIIKFLFVGVFLISGLITLVDKDLSTVNWLFSLLGWIMIIPGIMLVVRENGKIPLFILMAAIFFIYTILFGLFRTESFVEVISGIKRYFQLWSIALLVGYYDKEMWQREKLLTYMLYFAWIQLPVAAYELIYLVPIRESMNIPMLVPIDVVAGTFGAGMEVGGASNEMVIYLLGISVVLIMMYHEKLIDLNKLIVYITPCIIPFGMGETKLTIITLPIVYVIINQHSILKNLHKIIFSGILFATLIFTLSYVYAVWYDDTTVGELWELTYKYNAEEMGYGENVLNRTTTILFWLEKHGLNNLFDTLFGHGIGSTNGGQGDLFSGHLERIYSGFGVGLTTISTLLWETGLVGVILYLSFLILCLIYTTIIIRKTTVSLDKAFLYGVQLWIIELVIFSFVSNSILSLLSIQGLFSFCFGLVVLIARDSMQVEHPPFRSDTVHYE